MKNSAVESVNRVVWRDEADFRAAVGRWATTIRVTPRAVRVQPMRKKWASCSQSGIVTFSRDLLSLSPRFGEAVIVHELVHLIVRNHGKLFRSMVLSFTRGQLPDVSELRNQGSDDVIGETRVHI